MLLLHCKYWWVAWVSAGTSRDWDQFCCIRINFLKCMLSEHLKLLIQQTSNFRSAYAKRWAEANIFRCCPRASHWQESQSQEISKRNDSYSSLSSWRIVFSFLFLFSIFKILRHKFSFSSRFVRFLKQFSFSSRFSRLWRQKSLSTLDLWK